MAAKVNQRCENYRFGLDVRVGGTRQIMGVVGAMNRTHNLENLSASLLLSSLGLSDTNVYKP